MEIQIPVTASDYKGSQDHWENLASIRTRPRRIVNTEQTEGYYYPVARQPLCVHPLVKALGEQTIHYILIQTAYKFMLDIAFVETEVINKTALKIANKKFNFRFPEELYLDAFTIIIDETYHAYVAIDFIQQLEKKTGIKPLEKAAETELSSSMAIFMQQVPEELHDIFELIAVCIGENTLTKELFSMTNDKSLNRIFHEVMADHMIDEGRHSKIFSAVLKMLWSALTDDVKNIIGKILPEFVIDYLKPDLHIAHDRKILASLRLPADQIEIIIKDTHVKKTIQEFKIINPIVGNIMKVLERNGLLAHPNTRAAFEESGLI